jgi:CheY-like chemotaxis protein
MRKPGILIADDMALILSLLKFELEDRGFSVWLAVDGGDALELYQNHRGDIDLVLLDVQMPGMDGLDALEALRRLNPDVVTCFMTGNAGTYSQADLAQRGAAWVFTKPFRPDDVAVVLQHLTSASAQTRLACGYQNAPAGELQPCGSDSSQRS